MIGRDGQSAVIRILFAILVACLNLSAQEGKAVFEKSVAPFLGKHCSACHNAKV